MSRDLLSEIDHLPDFLIKRNFRQIKLFKSDKVQLWTCIIEYGFGDFVEGFGVVPESAIESSLNTLYQYMKDGMPKMEQRAILEKYDPIGLKLVEERWKMT